MHETSCSEVKDVHCLVGEVIVNGAQDNPDVPIEAQGCTAEMNGWEIQNTIESSWVIILIEISKILYVIYICYCRTPRFPTTSSSLLSVNAINGESDLAIIHKQVRFRKYVISFALLHPHGPKIIIEKLKIISII